MYNLSFSFIIIKITTNRLEYNGKTIKLNPTSRNLYIYLFLYVSRILFNFRLKVQFIIIFINNNNLIFSSHFIFIFIYFCFCTYILLFFTSHNSYSSYLKYSSAYNRRKRIYGFHVLIHKCI